MPAIFHNAAAHSCPALGFTWSRPAYVVGSVRIDVAWIHAGRSTAAAACSLPITTAHAPSDDGQVSSYRIGSHSIWDSCTFSIVMSGCCRCAYGFLAALRRSLAATIAPTWFGAPERRM